MMEIRAGDTRGPTDGDDNGGELAQGVDKQTESQGDKGDPEGQGGSSRSGRDPVDRSRARATKDEGGAGGKEKADRAIGAW